METSNLFYPRRDFIDLNFCSVDNSNVISFADGKVLIVKCHNQTCKHRLMFGNSTICLDAKRKELYQKTGK